MINFIERLNEVQNHLEISKEDLGVSRMKLVFLPLGNISKENGKLNRYNMGEEITYLIFFRNTFSLKSGLEV